MAPWLAVLLYMGVLYVLIHGGYALTRLHHARRLKAKAAHDDLLRRRAVKKRMYVVPRERVTQRRTASP